MRTHVFDLLQIAIHYSVSLQLFCAELLVFRPRGDSSVVHEWIDECRTGIGTTVCC